MILSDYIRERRTDRLDEWSMDALASDALKLERDIFKMRLDMQAQVHRAYDLGYKDRTKEKDYDPLSHAELYIPIGGFYEKINDTTSL